MTKPRSNRAILLFCIALPILGRGNNAFAEDAGYVVQKTLHVGGDGGFDFATIDVMESIYICRDQVILKSSTPGTGRLSQIFPIIRGPMALHSFQSRGADSSATVEMERSKSLI